MPATAQKTSPLHLDPPLATISACQHFLATSTSAEIAARIRQESDACHSSSAAFTSPLVYCLPPPASPEAYPLLKALSNDPRIHTTVARLRYAGILETIKSHLKNLSPLPDIPAHLVPNDDDYSAALKVMQYIQMPPRGISDNATFQEIVGKIQSELALGEGVRKELGRATPIYHKPKAPNRIAGVASTPAKQHAWQSRPSTCYICHYILTSPHPMYPSLCNPCGSFNLAESALSMPGNLNLRGKTALVTGGRVNLGFHTALRLLRCGAGVVVSSRYPLDAETRYLAEKDADEWKARLKVVGADFRTAADVFALIKAVRRCLKEWGNEKLDILVNNAAQTLTDGLEQEKYHVQREDKLLDSSGGILLLDAGYVARVRGEARGLLAHNEAKKMLPAAGGSVEEASGVEENGTLVTKVQSSWTQHIGEIPYEDVISAHSVNTFVPFILLRELLSIMGSQSGITNTPRSSSNPAAYVINVSSREGLFEAKPAHASKSGHHVHTNMSKAALNMLTETEAGEAWKDRRVAVNSVDPGYMSGDKEWLVSLGRDGNTFPIGWEDGAGRVLWVVAKGESGEPIWGRFLKNFGSVAATR